MKYIALIPWNGGPATDEDLFFVSNGNNQYLPGGGEWAEIRKILLGVGWELHTIGYYSKLEKVDVFVFCYWADYWYKLVLNNHWETKTIYLALEPPVVDYVNSQLTSLLRFFHVVMTWNDDFVDNERTIKFMYPYSFCANDLFSSIPFNSKKLLTNISGRKYSCIKNELYSERERVIQYFDSKGCFDLYGRGWKDRGFYSYKGEIASKAEAYKNYRFALCLENEKNVRGYITEKILDCFCSGVVPIYQGASNINEYIPSDCYIDYDRFNHLDDLYAFLLSVEESQYNDYLIAIKRFLSSNRTGVFSPLAFSQQLIKAIDLVESSYFKCESNYLLRRLRTLFIRLNSIAYDRLKRFNLHRMNRNDNN